ncbi:MAG: hypothetical protein ACXQTI_07930 [Candidatus Nezhaarchaeales archaeon]
MGEHILIDKHRDPQGNFVVLTTLNAWKILEPKLNVGDLEGIKVDFSGEKVFLKCRSRAKLKVIIDKAKMLGISVSGSL